MSSIIEVLMYFSSRPYN